MSVPDGVFITDFADSPRFTRTQQILLGYLAVGSYTARRVT